MILAILQGRLSSRRLPGKVLRPILGRPMIVQQIERLRRCRFLDGLVVATSNDQSDDTIAATCADEDLPCVRGPLNNVLARFCKVVEQYRPDHVVRLTADCPLADWDVIDALIQRHLDTDADYSTNALQRTFPKGLDCEVIRADVLRRINEETRSPFDREHVTPFVYRDASGYSISHLTQDRDTSFLRWTVDLPSDFTFATKIYEHLYPDNSSFTSADVLDLLQRQPELRFVNADGMTEQEIAKAQDFWVTPQ